MKTKDERLQMLFDLNEKLECMQDLNMTDGMIVRAALKDPEESVRGEAVTLISEIPGSETELRNLFVGMFQDPATAVRKAAYNELTDSTFPVAPVMDSLKQAIMTETDESAACAAMEAYGHCAAFELSESEQAESFDWLAGAMQRDFLRDSEVCRFTYHFSRYRAELPGSLQEVLKHLNSRDITIRLMTVLFLEDEGWKEDYPAIRAALRARIKKESDRQVRELMKRFITSFQERC